MQDARFATWHKSCLDLLVSYDDRVGTVDPTIVGNSENSKFDKKNDIQSIISMSVSECGDRQTCISLVDIGKGNCT
jgi:hypothetical protein